MLCHPTCSTLFLLVLRAFSPGSWSVPAGSSDVWRVLSQAPGCFSRTLGQPPAWCALSCQASRCLSHSSPVSLRTCSMWQVPLGTRQRELPMRQDQLFSLTQVPVTYLDACPAARQAETWQILPKDRREQFQGRSISGCAYQHVWERRQAVSGHVVSGTSVLIPPPCLFWIYWTYF